MIKVIMDADLEIREIWQNGLDWRGSINKEAGAFVENVLCCHIGNFDAGVL